MTEPTQEQIKLVPTDQDRFESLCFIRKIQAETRFWAIWEVIKEN